VLLECLRKLPLWLLIRQGIYIQWQKTGREIRLKRNRIVAITYSTSE